MSGPQMLKDAFVAIHGHFYQPPRENSWLDVIETEESAKPFHDWNERIAFECYRPNAHARIVDSQGKILDIVNNYSSMSFNFGPTLFRWLEKRFPVAYERILEADQESLKRFGHGNAIGQVYNHIIMPLANEKDKETEVLWGMADFERRFNRKPDAIWLPETAVNWATLEVLIKHDLQYLILSPFQARKVKSLGTKQWTDVSSGRIDPTQPYRWFMKDQAGKKIPDQFIDLFFYDGSIAKEASFGDLLKDGNAFCERFVGTYQPTKKRPQLIHIATDGETYGHHKKFGDMALAYALSQGFRSRGLEVINYGAFLKRFPPVCEVEIDEGPEGEGTSWSCAHGVGRWKEDCGCSTGGREGWNQKWRKPLREALNLLRDKLGHIFEEKGKEIFRDPWMARDGYIEVVLDRSSLNGGSFFKRYGLEELNDRQRIKGLQLLEMERHCLKMFTSCGWFFADLGGLETLIVLQHAARAIQFAEEWNGKGIEEEFLRRLSPGQSNQPEMGNGEEIYRRLVKPKSVTPEKVVNHYAISSLFDDGEKKRRIFAYCVERMDYEKIEKNGDLLVLGRVRVVSEAIPEPKEFLFGLTRSEKGIFQTRISEPGEGLDFDILKQRCLDRLREGRGGVDEVLASVLGSGPFSVQDIFGEEKQALFQKLFEKELKEQRRIYAELFDRTKQAVSVLAEEGLEIPHEIRAAAEVTLNDQLVKELQTLKENNKAPFEPVKIEEIVEMAGRLGCPLKKEEPALILTEILTQKIRALNKILSLPPISMPGNEEYKAEKVKQVMDFMGKVEKWGFDLGKGEAQNLMSEMLNEYVLPFEESLWEGWMKKDFPPNLINLAEMLGFNVDRFSKIEPK